MNEVLYSDWFVFNIIEHTTKPLILYNLKLSNKWHYKNITYSHIKQIVIKNITKKLKEHVNVNYNDFVKFMEQYDMKISGSFILQCILDEYWGEELDKHWMEPGFDMYTNMNKRLIDTKIFVDKGYGVDLGIQNIIVCIHENKKYLSFDITFIQKPYFGIDILENIYSIINGKHILYIDKLQNIMNKEILFDFMHISHHLPLYKSLYENRGFIFKNILLGNHIYYDKQLIPIVIINYELGFVCMFNKIFSFDPDITSQNFVHEDVMITIDRSSLLLNKINCSCDETSLKHDILLKCPIQCFDKDIVHYHSKITISHLKLVGLTEYDCIIIKYSNNEMLSLYNNIFNGIENDKKYDNMFLNFDDFKKIKLMNFKPVIKHDLEHF